MEVIIILDMDKIKMESDIPITKWDYFKIIINSWLYPIQYVEDNWIHWHYFKQTPREEYTTIHHHIQDDRYQKMMHLNLVEINEA